MVWFIPIILGFSGIAIGVEVDPVASMNGRYSGLIKTIHCPYDEKQYGQFKEQGYWAGEDWCGVSSIAGYLVWAKPDWYVWRHRARNAGGSSRPYVPGYDSNAKKPSSKDCRPVHTGVVIIRPC